MTKLEIILVCISTLSIIFNGILVAYTRATITRLLEVSEELGDLQQMVNAFALHLKEVYELETFYGDQTLMGLLSHAISFNEQLETFEHIYSLTEEEADDNTTEEDAPEDEEA